MTDAREYINDQGIESALASAVAMVIKERPSNAIERISELLMTPCYFIGHFTIKNPDGFMGGYASKIGPTLKAFGGKFIVLAKPGTDVVAKEEGDSLGQVHVVIQFSSREKALGWYESDSYSALKAVRDETSSLRGLLVDGLSPPSMGSGFFIGHFTLKDPPGFLSGYASKVGATIAPFGASFIVLAKPDPNKPTAIAKEEGPSLGQVHVIIQFKTKEAALEWEASGEYGSIKAARDASSALSGLIVAGMA